MAWNNLKFNENTYAERLLELGISTITLAGPYYNSRTHSRHHCSVCGGFFDANPDNIMRGKGCPYCSGHKVLIGFNDMATTRPDMVQYLADPEDAYRYTAWTPKKLRWKCPDCGAEKNTAAYSVARKFSCSKCGDGISYPEKFMYSVLEQSNIEFSRQITSAVFPWCDKYRYDFYFEHGGRKIIIETNGPQHYEGTRTFFGQNNDEILSDDIVKRDLALANGIDEFISIDCSESNLNYMRASIIASPLAKYISHDIDWTLCHKMALKSYIPIIAKMFNEGKSVSAIADELKLSQCMIRKGLQKAETACLCNYEELKQWNNPTNFSVVHLETGKLYPAIHSASVELNIHPNAISRCCKNLSTVGITRDGIPTHWMFSNEYKPENDYTQIMSIQKIPNRHNRKVVCLNTGDMFDTAAEAGRWAGVKSISNGLRKRQITCGKHPETGEPLRWEYAEVLL